MSLELWMLAEDREIQKLLRELADSEDMQIRRFSDIARIFNNAEPEEGVILAIDSEACHSNYLTAVRKLRQKFFRTEVIVMGPSKSEEEIGNERYIGVDLYINKPVNEAEFFARASHICSLRRLKSSVGIVGRSQSLTEMLETVLQVAPTSVPVLLEGESGSGKELTARAIHLMSNRENSLFEAVNCGALAEGVLESELFGHERGAFTGAVSRRSGLFERADGGTLFLDEVGETSLNMQVRLLRVLETGEFYRVGGTKKLTSDVRVIAATNRELKSSVERGEFRNDLYYRLKVVKVVIPPLRARTEDIPILANFFLKRSAAKHNRKIKGISRDAIDILSNYSWPGNIRELSNVMDNLTVLSKSHTINAADVENKLKDGMERTRTVPDLPVRVSRSREEVERELIINTLLTLHNDVKEILNLLKAGAIPGGSEEILDNIMEVKEAYDHRNKNLRDLERDAVKEALLENDGNRRKAAEQLGISERTLYRRLKEFDIN